MLSGVFVVKRNRGTIRYFGHEIAMSQKSRPRMLTPMSLVATERKRPRTRRRAKRKRAGLLAWWPLLLALVITPFAVRAASVLVLSGPGALRLLYPFVVLLQAHAPASLAPEQRDTLAEWTMWAQLPIYGLVVSLAGRWRSIAAGLLTVLLLHAAALSAAILFAR